MKTNGVDSALDQARAEGTLDSEGHFTIAGRVALGKLAQFQLPRPTIWVLKVVQACVRSEASSLVIRQKRRATEFSFSPSILPHPGQLENLLTGRGDEESSSAHYLGVALRAVGMGQQRNFEIALRDEGIETIFRWQGGSLSKEVRARLGPPKVQLKVEASKCSSYARLMGTEILEEREELIWGCQACPIQVRLGGLRLDTLKQTEPTMHGVCRLSLAVVWKTLPPASTRQAISLPTGFSANRWRPTDKFRDRRVFYVEGPDEKQNLSFIARLAYLYKIEDSSEVLPCPDKSQVHWIKDGVHVQSNSLELSANPVQLELFLSADDLKTDLSGLRLVESEKMSTAVTEALQDLSGTLGGLIAAVKDHRDITLGWRSAVIGAFFVAHGLPFAVATKGLSLPLHLGMWKAFQEQETSNTPQTRPACLKDLALFEQNLLALS